MIDTHCHIDEPDYAEDLDAFLSAQREGGVERILIPGVDASSIVSIGRVCDLYPDYLFPAIGLHPENVKEDYKDQLNMLREELFSKRRNYIAIGEIGLDYHFDMTYKAEQQKAFHQQLLWARELDLPVMLHIRDAVEDGLRIVREVIKIQKDGLYPLRGVVHCFSGSHEVAEQWVKMGFYLGIGGVLTFKNSKVGEHLYGIPLQSLVLETDGPYMAPVPYRGKRNESRWMSIVRDSLADIYCVSPEDVDRVTTMNAQNLFRLKK